MSFSINFIKQKQLNWTNRKYFLTLFFWESWVDKFFIEKLVWVEMELKANVEKYQTVETELWICLFHFWKSVEFISEATEIGGNFSKRIIVLWKETRVQYLKIKTNGTLLLNKEVNFVLYYLLLPIIRVELLKVKYKNWCLENYTQLQVKYINSMHLSLLMIYTHSMLYYVLFFIVNFSNENINMRKSRTKVQRIIHNSRSQGY